MDKPKLLTSYLGTKLVATQCEVFVIFFFVHLRFFSNFNFLYVTIQ